MTLLKIKKLSESAIIPKYATQGDAGIDLHCTESVTIKPNERVLVPTGLGFVIPQGHVGLIWDRSGLAARNGITTFGGVIDSGYRGEVKVIMYNSSQEDFAVEKGMRIAQMLIQRVEQMQIQEVRDLDESQRGGGGFGSTGLH